MIITDSSIGLQGSHHFYEQRQERSSLTMWAGDRNSSSSVTFGENHPAQGIHRGNLIWMEERLKRLESASEQVNLSPQALASRPQKALVEPATAPSGAKSENLGDFKLSLLKMMVEQFTGRDIQLFDANELTTQGEPLPPLQDPATAGSTQPPPAAADQPQGWGVVYDHYESHLEQESSQFKASGVVKTADGKSIEINLELNLSRSFEEHNQISIKGGDALRDPLVINFNGNAAELGSRNFRFDIDADGRQHQIALLRPGSGFLALDKNGDQTINNGHELFGPRSGDGFGELAGYDDDGNGWIDGQDRIYDQLRIWSVDDSGKHKLTALGEHGIGALYLGKVDTPFLLKDQKNETLGAVAETGIFLRENGTGGTIQHIDLAV
ncbi:MAG: hypothetical protein HQL48_02810 [Gammaproteobacteria bacterium]|nr:hypothetical protein [Gammaproteobacteria bacterium]